MPQANDIILAGDIKVDRAVSWRKGSFAPSMTDKRDDKNRILWISNSTACRWVAMYVATWQQTLWTTAAYPIGGIGCIFQLGILAPAGEG